MVLDQPGPHNEPLLRDVMNRIRAIPGVQAAGSVDDLPLSTYEDKGYVEVEGYVSSERRAAAVRETAGEYFRAMQIPLIEGRYLNDGDLSANSKETPLTVVVSERFARHYWPGRAASGHRVRVNGGGWSTGLNGGWSTVVGVVGDVRHASVEETPEPIIYYQNGIADSVAIRTAAPPDQIIPAVRRAVSAASAEIRLTDIQTMDRYVDQAIARRRFQTAALGGFAGVAVLLALVGFYGLLSYTVMQRRAELGVRMALGASRRTVVGMVVRHGLALTATGLAAGLSLAALLTRALASFLYGVRPLDPVTFLAVPAFMILVALIACIVPAWKAASVDPVNALRRQ